LFRLTTNQTNTANPPLAWLFRDACVGGWLQPAVGVTTDVLQGGTERIVLDKLFTFRGDNDESWRRAEAFIADEFASHP